MGDDRFRVRMALSAFYFSLGLCFATWASRIPDIKQALHLNAAGLGTVLFALPVGQFLAMPFSGGAVTRFGSRRVGTLVTLGYAGTLSLIGLVTAPWQLALVLLMFGVFGNFCNIAINTQGVAVEKIYGRPIMASFHGAWSVAGFTGALVGLLALNLNLTPHRHFSAVAMGVALVILLNFRYLVAARIGDKGATKKPLFSFPKGILLQLGMIGFCSMATEGAMFDWSGVYFKEVVKAPPGLVPVGYASFMIMMASGRFVADRVLHRIGRRRLLGICGTLISTGMLTAVAFPYFVPAILAFFVVGLGVSAVVPTVYGAAGRAMPDSPGLALASVASVSYLGFLMGPPLIGWIASASSLRGSYGVIGVLGFGITVMVTRFHDIK